MPRGCASAIRPSLTAYPVEKGSGLIVGENAFTRAGDEEMYTRLGSEIKQIHVTPEATHFSMYDQEPYVSENTGRHTQQVRVANAGAAEGDSPVTSSTLIADVIGNPLLEDYGRFLFPIAFNPPWPGHTRADEAAQNTWILRQHENHGRPPGRPARAG